MDTIVITRTFEGDLAEKVAYARSLDSRLNWPGAVLEFEKPGMLCYGVGMRLKAATMTDITVEETLSDVETLDNGELLFSTVNKALWPDGHMSVIVEYRFTPGEGDEPHTLKYSYTFPPPSSKLVKPKQLPAFHVAMEKVCNRFVKGLLSAGGSGAKPVASEPLSVPAVEAAGVPAAPVTAPGAAPVAAPPVPATAAAAAPTSATTPAATPAASVPAPTVVPPAYQVAGMDTVAVTHGFNGELDAMVTFTRSLDSRTNWPGAVLEYEKADDTLYYGVGMRLSAATMTDISIEERLGEVERLDGGEIRYTTTQRVLWPHGHADAITEYLFRPGKEGAGNYMRFTYSYPPPSTKLVKTKELPAFHAAMEKVCNRYLDRLTRANSR